MKALIFEQAGLPGSVLQLSDIPVPIIGEQEVLVAVKARPVNPSDYSFIKGTYRRKPVFPQIAGLEGAGVIEAVGASVTGFKAGDQVAFRAPNTWAEYCVATPAQLLLIEKEMPFEMAAQFTLNTMTAIGLLEEASLKTGDFLLVNAASSSTVSLVLQMAVRKGIRVVALVSRPEHAPALEKLGAEKVLLQLDPNLTEQLQAFTAGVGFHALLDAVGGSQLTTLLPQMAIFGTVVLYGNLSNNEPGSFSNGTVIYKNLTIKGFGFDRWMSLQEPARIQSWYQSVAAQLHDGSLHFKPVDNISLEDFIAYNRTHEGIRKFILV